MKILVTGASGFIGSALVARLHASGIAVRAAVRAAGSVLDTPVERVVVGDIGPTTEWRTALERCTHVVHLAGRAHVLGRQRGESAARFEAVNTAGTLRLADQAGAAGVKRFVFASSIGVLGRASGRPVDEATPPAPYDAYSQAKLAAERGLAAIGAASAMQIVVVRPPLVYGPAAPGNLARLAALVRRGCPLPLGAVRNRRTLVGRENLVDLLVACLQHAAAAGETFVAGDVEPLSTADIVRFLAEGMQRPARLVALPAPLVRLAFAALGRGALFERLCGDLEVDAAKATRLLGWRPRVSAADGLRAAGRAYAGLSARESMH